MFFTKILQKIENLKTLNVLKIGGLQKMIYFNAMLLKDLKCVNSEINEEKIRKSLKTRENDIILNFQKIFKKGSDILNIENKGELLLEFRRYIEMLLREGTILCVRNLYDEKRKNICSHLWLFSFMCRSCFSSGKGYCYK